MGTAYEALRGTALFAEIPAVAMWTSVWPAVDFDPALCSCTFAVTRGQAKSFESSLVRFPQMLWFIASRNQPCLERLTEHLMGVCVSVYFMS